MRTREIKLTKITPLIKPPKMSLELIIGPMFAGKSSAILRLVNRYKSIQWSHCLISHAIDTRYSDNESVVNHDKNSIQCKQWSTLLNHKDDPCIIDAKVVIIDEGQFFNDLIEFVLYLVEELGKNVIVVGLDGDADRKPFGKILELIPLCDTITKLKAFCAICCDGTDALFTSCKVVKKDQVQVGGSDMYQPLCRKHYLDFHIR
jgi:thymidine kinase